MTRKYLGLAAVAVLSALLGGCPGIIAPGSQPYRPASDLEAQQRQAADFNIFPDDIRRDAERYRGRTVAWAGIIRASKITKEPQGYRMDFTLEHRYFDWIEDDSIQRARFFVSPRGEGKFTTSWSMPPTTDEKALADAAAPGGLLVVYGRIAATAVKDGVIQIDADYLRPYPSWWYADDVMDYSRPGSPVKILRVPMQ